MAKTRRPFDVTAPAQAAALASLDDPDEVERRRALNATALVRLDEGLHALGLAPTAGPAGNFLFLDTGRDAAPLFERLLEQGVIVRPLHGFGAPTAIRVSAGTPEENDLFLAALARVIPLVASQPAG
jgi:histidinol-phosphate aminotransferase